jgi:hypothetical protein
MSASVQVKGMEEFRAKMKAIGEDYFALRGRNDAYSAMKRSLYSLVYEMARYPEIGKSTYRRTGTLGRSWATSWEESDITQTGSTLTGKVGTNVEYAPLVQSHQFQRDIHRQHKWITDRQAIEKKRKHIEAEFASSLTAKLKEVGAA